MAKCSMMIMAAGFSMVESANLRQLPGGGLFEIAHPTGMDRVHTCSALHNQGSHFTIDVAVGTPPEKMTVVADTGSSGVIVKSCVCTGGTSPDCFHGFEGQSSTFTKLAVPKIQHHFGSGDLVTQPVKDVIKVGDRFASMDKLLLMVENKLLIPNFEGILGLGLPAHKNKYTDGNFLSDRQSFMDAAGVKFFSICFTGPSSPGVLRFDPPPATKMLNQMGLYHWGLAFEGFSVGSATAPSTVCNLASMTPGMKTACGAIPDSGTTDIMGPPKLINTLFADVCQRWKRCKEQVNQGLANAQNPFPEEKKRTDCASKIQPGVSQQTCEETWDALNAQTFRSLIGKCSTYPLSEVPSLFLHWVGKDQAKETTELTSWSYIYTNAYGHCAPMFGSYNMDTKVNGPIWVIGTPLFHEYQVVFGMDPLAIGFSNKQCQQCQGGQKSMNALANFAAMNSTVNSRSVPRLMTEAPRMPSFFQDEEVF